MTGGAQQALRRTMEIYSNTTRFAFACNMSNKIIEPIQSRCAILRYARLSDGEVLKRLLEVCEFEDVSSRFFFPSSRLFPSSSSFSLPPSFALFSHKADTFARRSSRLNSPTTDSPPSSSPRKETCVKLSTTFNPLTQDSESSPPKTSSKSAINLTLSSSRR